MLYLEVAFRVLGLIAIVFGSPMLFIYLLYKNIKEKKSPLPGLLFALGLLGYIYCAASMLSSVDSCYVGKGLYKRNRIYFYTFFLNKLKETSDVRKSAVYMLQDKYIVSGSLPGGKEIVCTKNILKLKITHPQTIKHLHKKSTSLNIIIMYSMGCLFNAIAGYYLTVCSPLAFRSTSAIA